MTYEFWSVSRLSFITVVLSHCVCTLHGTTVPGLYRRLICGRPGVVFVGSMYGLLSGLHMYCSIIIVPGFCTVHLQGSSGGFRFHLTMCFVQYCRTAGTPVPCTPVPVVVHHRFNYRYW